MKSKLVVASGPPAVLSAALLLSGCSDGSRVDLPRPEMAGVEDEVVQAVESTQEAVGREPDSAEAWGRLGERYLDFDWAAEAAQCFDRAERLDPTNFRWPYLLGHSLLLDDPLAASGAFGRALALDDGYAPAHLHQARALVRLGEAKEARHHFEAAAQQDPRSSHPLLGLGQLALSSGGFEEARDYLEQALERNPRHGKAHHALSQTYFALGDEERAQRHAGIARDLPADEPIVDPRLTSSLEPAGSRLLLHRGIVRVGEGKLDEAARYLSRVVEINPRLELAHFNLGVVAVRKGNLDEAEAHLREALRLKAAYVEAHALLGNVLSRRGKPEEAVAYLGEAARMNPDQPLVQYLLGRNLAALEREEEAETHFREALRTSPGHAGAHLDLGLLLMNREKPGEASEHFQEVLRIGLKDIRQLSNRAALSSSMGKEAEAGRIRREIRRIEWRSAEAHNLLGRLLTKEGNLDEALHHLLEASGIRPDHAGTHVNLGRVLVEQGEIDSALAQFRAALRLDPEWAEAARSLAWILSTHEDPRYRNGDEAVQWARQSCEATARKDPAALDTLAAAFAEAGRFEEAVETAREALGVARSRNRSGLAQEIQERLRLYEDRRPFRSPR